MMQEMNQEKEHNKITKSKNARKVMHEKIQGNE